MIFSLLLVTTLVHAQDITQDTLEARSYYDKASEALARNDTKAAIALNKKVIQLYNKHQLYEDALRVDGFNLDYYRRIKEYEVGKQEGKRVVKEIKQKLGPNSRRLAIVYSSLGNLYSQTADLKEALAFQKKALAILENKKEEDVQVDIRMVCTNRAIAYYYIGQIDSAIYFFQKSERLITKYEGEGSKKLGGVYGNLAAMYQSKGQYEDALKNLFEALALEKKDTTLAGKKGRARLYRNIAVMYNSIQEPNLALEYLDKAYALLVDIWGKEHPRMIAVYEVRPVIYAAQGKFNEAISDFLMVKTILEEENKEPKDLAQVYSNLSGVYHKVKNYETSEKYIYKAIEINKKIGGENYYRLASNYNNLAALFYGLGRQEESDECKKKAVKILRKTYGNKHPELASSYTSLANSMTEQGRFEEGLTYFQQAIKSNTFFNTQQPNLQKIIENKDYLSSKELNRTLRWQARFYLRWYQSTTDTAKLQAALASIEQAKQLVDAVKNNLSESEDKKVLLQTTNSVNKVAMSICYAYYKKTQNLYYIQRAFDFAEANKSAILLDVLKDRYAKQFGAIPDSVRKQENELLSKVSQLEEDILHAKLNQSRDKAAALKEQLFDTKRELDLFYKKMSEVYANYVQLKQQGERLDIRAIQNDLLSNGQALIEFFVSDSTVYQFVITPESIAFRALQIEKKVLKDKVGQLREALSNYKFILNQKEKAKEAYIEAASWFYQAFWKPIAQDIEGVEQVIIIPDNILGYIPFEALLVEQADLSTEYNAMHYLVQDYIIHYGYSAQLMLENTKFKKQSHSTGFQMLAMASSYPPLQTGVLNKRSDLQQRLRKSLKPIPAVNKEIDVLKALFPQGTFYQSIAGNEANFKAAVGQHNLVHLAMHGTLNTNHPIASSMAFTENGDSLEDNFLYAYEISQLEMNADLVVLSACETGYGKFEQGEGIMSLARSFMYAGVPSLVVSLWQVNDATTAAIMELFYKKIKEGAPIDVALTIAKRRFIQQAKGIVAHPAYWAPFVHLGDSHRIAYRSNTWMWWTLGGGLLVLLGLGVWRFRRKEAA